MVTAELAMTLPLLLAVTAGLAWLLSVGVAQVRVVDAARETARAVARGDSTEAAAELGRSVAPPGAAVEVDASGDTVTVTASVVVAGPGGLFGFLPDARVRARAVAAAEPVP
ncbi:MAG: TadE family protein [Nocardioidaceae bacterium]